MSHRNETALPAGNTGGPPSPAGNGSAGPRSEALIVTGEMYAMQEDQLAQVLSVSRRRAGAIATRWRQAGWARTARLSQGPRWIWLTRAGLAFAGLPYTARPPGLSRLAHIRAVTAVRLALQQAPGYQPSGAYWRSERRLRARMGGRAGLREHVPDGEVHWPQGAPLAWAGECWAIEAELTPKTLARTTAIMREILTRTGDYGCPAAQVQAPGAQPRHARAIYLCSVAARPVVTRAREAMGDLGARIEIRMLPACAELGADLSDPAQTRPGTAP